MDNQYITLVPIYHTGEERNYGPGELVSMEHLPAATVRTLVLQGVLAEAGDLTQVAGIGAERARALILAGVRSLQDLIEADPAELEERTGITAKQLRAWQEKSRQICEAQITKSTKREA